MGLVETSVFLAAPAAYSNTRRILVLNFISRSWPAATAWYWGKCPPKVWCPPNLVVARKMCFKRITKTKIFPP